MEEKIGKLIVIVAPSGTGKSSLMRRLKDEDFLPPQLLGAGVVSNAIVGWPLHRMSTKLKMYYLCAFAYHGHSLIALTRPKSLIRNDFFEMAIHHTATLLLMSMSWLLNWVRV